MANNVWNALLSPLKQGFDMNTITGADLDKWIQFVGQESQIVRDREDSAYQRMVADMKKAGLNPWQGIASGGSPTSNVNPAMDQLTSLVQILGNNQNYMNTVLKGVNTGSEATHRFSQDVLSFWEALWEGITYAFKGGF